MDKNIPFPQANDFEKIITILNLSDESFLNIPAKLKEIMGDISERQVSYYVSAAMFLGLVDAEEGAKRYTEKAKIIRAKSTCEQIAELISTITMNPIFNRIYVNTLLFGKQELADISDVIRKYYPLYSDAIYERRAQTASKWIDWVLAQTEKP